MVVPEAILNRRQKKKEKSFKYQVKWAYKDVEQACWVERETLIKMGYLKMVQREDEKQAAMAGLMTKQLTQPCIEKHLKDFGVDPEYASHTQINQMSGGMKVKVVLAAAMWQNPHILILDEPTNYLDREGLGALVLAIKEYKGGVLIISHNKEFCDGVATEKWIMKGGYLRIEGESKEDVSEEQTSGNKEIKEVYDASGNKIDVKAQAALSDKDRKKKIKDLEKKTEGWQEEKDPQRRGVLGAGGPVERVAGGLEGLRFSGYCENAAAMPFSCMRSRLAQSRRWRLGTTADMVADA